MKRPARASRCLAGAILAVCATACVTPAGGVDVSRSQDDASVVERSKAEAPRWASLQTGRFHEQDGALAFVGRGIKLRDLPLGLKQTQLEAMEASRDALKLALSERVEDWRGDLSASSQAELERRIGDVADDACDRHVKITDVYFEKLEASGDPAEYFNAFVLVTLPKDRLAEALEALGRRLSQSGDSALRTVGQSLSARVKGDGLSH